MRIAVLCGGWSGEREVSIASGKNVAQILTKSGHDVTIIDVKKDLKKIVDDLYNANPDYVYNALHGTGGEDGVIQGVLEIYGKPYSNSNVLGSSISFSKSVTKTLVSDAGVNVAKGVIINSQDLATMKITDIGVKLPFVIKPDQNGSSIGVSIINSEQDFIKLRSQKWKYGEIIIVEEFIKGDEITLAICDGEILGHIKIVFAHNFYDYSSKYDIGGSIHVDATLSEQQKNTMYTYAKKAYTACRCKDLARIDFIINEKEVVFMEINTQPGMTATSLVPDIAKNNNIDINDILLAAYKNYTDHNT